MLKGNFFVKILLIDLGVRNFLYIYTQKVVKNTNVPRQILKFKTTTKRNSGIHTICFLGFCILLNCFIL